MTVTASTRRLFVVAPLVAGAVVTLDKPQSHYVVNVLRLRAGQGLLVFNGRDGEWRAEVADIRKTACVLRALEQVRAQVSEPDVWLAFAPLKRSRIDMAVEKASELGVALLCPVDTERTNADRVNVARLRATAIEAAEQCGRLVVPEVREPVGLGRLIADWPAQRRLFVLDESGSGQPIAAALAKHAGEACGFLIGPEGGFAPSEIAALRRQPFVVAVGLGRRLLRAETAAMAALACWQAVAGDWR
jgi:16S rRNA (uracil1498-N3)-methyltransferase